MNGFRVARAYGDLLALLVGGLLVLGGSVWFGLEHLSTARLDHDVFAAYSAPSSGHTGVTNWVFDHIDAGPVLAVTAVCAVLALVQRQVRLAVAIPAFAGIALWVTDHLKGSVLHRAAGLPVAPLSLPSGHTTAALVIGICLVLGLPRTLRPLGSLLAGFVAGAVGLGVLAWHWHRPSDVVAACGVVMAVAAVALAASARYTARPRVRAAGFDRAVGHPALASLGGALAFWGWWHAGLQPLSGSRAHTLFYGAAVVLVLALGHTIGLCAVVADRHLLPGSTWWPKGKGTT